MTPRSILACHPARKAVVSGPMPPLSHAILAIAVLCSLGFFAGCSKAADTAIAVAGETLPLTDSAEAEFNDYADAPAPVRDPGPIGNAQEIARNAIIMTFYPLGWSDDGKFAYVQEDEFTEERTLDEPYMVADSDGGYLKESVVGTVIRLKLVLFDTVDDKVLLEYETGTEVQDLDFSEASSPYRLRDVVAYAAAPHFSASDTIWEFLDRIAEAGIKPLSEKPHENDELLPTFINAFPFDADGVRYEAVLKSGLSDPGDDFNRKLDWNLKIVSGAGVSKTITAQSAFAYNASVVGYMRNPFLDQIVAVVAVYRHTGPMTVAIDYVVSGCMLDTGFN